MIVTEIISDPNPKIIDIIKKELSTISHQDLHNIENYQGLFDNIDEYDCFHVVTENDILVGFSGLYSKRWGNIGRAIQRAYKNPLFRRKGLSYNSSPNEKQHLWSTLFLPLQIEFAKKIELDAIFVSTEFPRRWSSLERFTRLANEYLNEYSFEILPDMYFVCNKYNEEQKYIGSHLSKTCWQNITLCRLNNEYVFDFELMTHNEWKNHFES